MWKTDTTETSVTENFTLQLVSLHSVKYFNHTLWKTRSCVSAWTTSIRWNKEQLLIPWIPPIQWSKTDQAVLILLFLNLWVLSPYISFKTEFFNSVVSSRYYTRKTSFIIWAKNTWQKDYIEFSKLICMELQFLTGWAAIFPTLCSPTPFSICSSVCLW